MNALEYKPKFSYESILSYWIGSYRACMERR